MHRKPASLAWKMIGHSQRGTGYFYSLAPFKDVCNVGAERLGRATSSPVSSLLFHLNPVLCLLLLPLSALLNLKFEEAR